MRRRHGRGRGRREARGTLVAATVLAACALSAAPAHAGFSFAESFGGVPALTASGAAGRFDDPFRLDASPDGSTLYVVDRGNDRISKWVNNVFERAWGKNVSPSGGSGFEICTTTCQPGSTGQGLGELNFSWGIAVAPNGTDIYLADYFNHRVQQYTAGGTPVRAWGLDVNQTQAGPGFEVCAAPDICKAGAFPTTGVGGSFDRPAGIGVAPNGDVYVTDRDEHRVQQFTSTGSFVRAFGWDVNLSQAGTGFEVCAAPDTCKAGVPGFGVGQFLSPGDVSVDAAGVVSVVDDGDRVQRFAADGTYLGVFGSLGTAPGQFSDPRTIDIAASGELLITQLSNPSVVHRYRGPGDVMELFDEGAGILESPEDAVFGAPGNAYLAKSTRNRVDRFTLTDVPIPPAPQPQPVGGGTPEPEPASQPPPRPAALPAVRVASVVSFPSVKACVSRRSFRIRLRSPKGGKLKEAIVSLNGKRVQVVRGKRLTAPVDLRGLPKGRFSVKIAITLVDGRRVSATRRYRTCAPKRG